ncbi:MAG: ABC transporter substrate-binding protein [Acidobacteria bacterium]|nr:ABC transporter substrate-binding protein [Acidobacteriota bacterium]
MGVAWSVLLSILISTGCQSKRDPGTVVMLIESSPISLDPRVGTDAQSERIGELIFDSLLRRNDHSQLQPALATHWESPDPLTHVFHLRNDVRFHDGRPLRAQDVRYTLQSLLSGEVKSVKTANFSRVASVEAPDDWTVIIRLKEPYSSFLWNLTQGALGIVPEGSGSGFASSPIGSGPFRFVSSRQDESVTIEKNSDYWDTPPFIERAEFRIVPDATTRALELRNGSADIVLNSLPADTVVSLQKEPHLRVSQQLGNTYQYLGLNLASPQLTIPVRQALAYAIDRDALIKHLWRDLVRPANSVLPIGHWAHAVDLESQRYDPQRAIDLLERAGYHTGGDGSRLTLVMKTSTDQAGRELSAVLQDQLRKIGVKIEIRSYEFATFYSDITKGNFDLFSLRWIGGNNDPDIFEYLFHSEKTPPAGANRGRYHNPNADKLIERGRMTSNLAERRDAYLKLQSLLNQDLPYIHLWYLDNVAVYDERIAGLQIDPTGNYHFMMELQLIN